MVIGIDLTPVEPIAGATVLAKDFYADDAPAALLTELLGGPADVVLSDMAASATGETQVDHMRIMGLAEARATSRWEILKPGGAYRRQGAARRRRADPARPAPEGLRQGAATSSRGPAGRTRRKCMSSVWAFAARVSPPRSPAEKFHVLSACTAPRSPSTSASLAPWPRSSRRARPGLPPGKVDEAVLAATRLIPDMLPFTRQVQIACRFAESAARWPVSRSYRDNAEKALSEPQKRIAAVLAYIEGFVGRADRGGEGRGVS